MASPIAGWVACVLVLTGWMTPARADAQTARNVLVVVNAASADSVQIGEYYARKRQIPDDQVLRLTELPADPPDGIDRPAFDRAINSPDRPVAGPASGAGPHPLHRSDQGHPAADQRQ